MTCHQQAAQQQWEYNLQEPLNTIIIIIILLRGVTYGTGNGIKNCIYFYTKVFFCHLIHHVTYGELEYDDHHHDHDVFFLAGRLKVSRGPRIRSLGVSQSHFFRFDGPPEIYVEIKTFCVATKLRKKLVFFVKLEWNATHNGVSNHVQSRLFWEHVSLKRAIL